MSIEFTRFHIHGEHITLDGRVQAWRVEGHEDSPGHAGVSAKAMVSPNSDAGRALAAAVATINEILNQELKWRLQ